ncbi:histidine--tRNA ligase [Candidatus Gottesmanbacteria bacterium]|nr:histidine--tRNA ligase [Candidatus Gottesmanbacteria bacterium]
MITPQTLKGFRDFLPLEAIKRQYAINIIRDTFESFGFEPLETPAVEYLETFAGNVGEDEKLFFKFQDQGKRWVALRYDQTVPTCRVIAQYPNEIKLPFKRYQIQTVWRSEKPQKGRFREFLQCDADIFGVDHRASDGETVALTIQIFKNLGFKNPTAIINDRALYQDVPYKAIVAIDKLAKIGDDGVVKELVTKGYSESDAVTLLKTVKESKPNEALRTIFSFLDSYGMKENYRFEPTLARSFNYSTGTIWEIVDPAFTSGSMAGCERFDSLVGKFSNRNVPAVGFAVGFDRTILAMDELGLFPNLKTKTMVVVTVFNENMLADSQKIAEILRESKIHTDLYPDPNAKLDKQLKYADNKGVPYVIIQGPEEKTKNIVKLKNMQTKEQLELSLDDVIRILTKDN